MFRRGSTPTFLRTPHLHCHPRMPLPPPGGGGIRKKEEPRRERRLRPLRTDLVQELEHRRNSVGLEAAAQRQRAELLDGEDGRNATAQRQTLRLRRRNTYAHTYSNTKRI